MAIICREYGILFLMSPRTGCTALGQALINELKGEYLPQKSIFDKKGFFKVQNKHCSLKELITNNILTEKEASSLIKFASVRNPFDSLVSLYEKKRNKYSSLKLDPESWVYKVPGYVEDMEYCEKHPFTQWVIKRYYKRYIKKTIIPFPGFTMYEKFTEQADFILKFESLQEDFSDFLKRIKIDKEITIPKINQTSGRKLDYRCYYDSISRHIVKHAFREDFQRYNYSF